MAWSIRKMHGRNVSCRKILPTDPESIQKCADCNCPSTAVIVEMEGISKPPLDYFPVVWGWCEKCDIGG